MYTSSTGEGAINNRKQDDDAETADFSSSSTRIGHLAAHHLLLLYLCNPVSLIYSIMCVWANSSTFVWSSVEGDMFMNGLREVSEWKWASANQGTEPFRDWWSWFCLMYYYHYLLVCSNVLSLLNWLTGDNNLYRINNCWRSATLGCQQ